MFGPPLGTDITGQSLTVLAKMLDGKVPMVPDAAFPMVDVRDVAKLHVDAIKNKNVAGQRFIASGTEPTGFADAAQILLDEGYKGPSTKNSQAGCSKSWRYSIERPKGCSLWLVCI